MLLALDFDGTVTEEDTLGLIVERWAPERWGETEDALHAGRMTLDEVIVHQFAHVAATRGEILAYLAEAVRLRPGLAELLAFARARFVEPVVVSGGFRSLIEPVLAGAGLDIPVVAHDAVFSADGAVVHLRSRPACGVCGQPCKRATVRRLAGGRPVAYVGDGYSDRCAARDAHLVFARAGLARTLDDEGVAYVPFGDFHDVRRGLERHLDPGRL